MQGFLHGGHGGFVLGLGVGHVGNGELKFAFFTLEARDVAVGVASSFEIVVSCFENVASMVCMFELSFEGHQAAFEAIAFVSPFDPRFFEAS